MLAGEADRIATQVRGLADRLAAIEAEDDRQYSKADVDSILEGRLARERKRTHRAEQERDELELELESLRDQTP